MELNELRQETASVIDELELFSSEEEFGGAHLP